MSSWVAFLEAAPSELPGPLATGVGAPFCASHSKGLSWRALEAVAVAVDPEEREAHGVPMGLWADQLWQNGGLSGEQ